MSDEDNDLPEGGNEPVQAAEASEGGADDAESGGVDFAEMTDEMMSAGFADSPKDVEAIYDIPVQISAVLGRATMQVSQLLKLGRGAVVELDRKVGEAIDIYVNNRLVARGEVVVNEDRLGVTMTEIVKSDRTRQ